MNLPASFSELRQAVVSAASRGPFSEPRQDESLKASGISLSKLSGIVSSAVSEISVSEPRPAVTPEPSATSFFEPRQSVVSTVSGISCAKVRQVLSTAAAEISYYDTFITLVFMLGLISMTQNILVYFGRAPFFFNNLYAEENQSRQYRALQAELTRCKQAKQRLRLIKFNPSRNTGEMKNLKSQIQQLKDQKIKDEHQIIYLKDKVTRARAIIERQNQQRKELLLHSQKPKPINNQRLLKENKSLTARMEKITSSARKVCEITTQLRQDNMFVTFDYQTAIQRLALKQNTIDFERKMKDKLLEEAGDHMGKMQQMEDRCEESEKEGRRARQEYEMSWRSVVRDMRERDKRIDELEMALGIQGMPAESEEMLKESQELTTESPEEMSQKSSSYGSDDNSSEKGAGEGKTLEDELNDGQFSSGSSSDE